MHDVRLEAELLVQARHEESVTGREECDGQDANDEEAASTVEEALVRQCGVGLREGHAVVHQAAQHCERSAPCKSAARMRARIHLLCQLLLHLANVYIQPESHSFAVTVDRRHGQPTSARKCASRGKQVAARCTVPF